MNGEKADMVFTDPPYGVAIGDKNATLNSIQPSGRCCENIEGDTMTEAELYEMLKTNRKARCMELDPHYCDVIIQRWENLTGGKAVLLNDAA